MLYPTDNLSPTILLRDEKENFPFMVMIKIFDLDGIQIDIEYRHFSSIAYALAYDYAYDGNMQADTYQSSVYQYIGTNMLFFTDVYDFIA